MIHTTKEIINLLERFYHQRDEWACVIELRSAGYSGEESRVDLWAIHCTPSDGMRAHAYEIKRSRGDWLNELKHPVKRKFGLAVSNYFWIVAVPGVVKPEEVPGMIGLIEVDHNYLKKIISAEYRDKVRPTWALVAGMIRKILKQEAKRLPNLEEEI